MRSILAFSLLAFTTAQSAAAVPQQAPVASGVESLGSELLDDLNPNIGHPPATGPRVPSGGRDGSANPATPTIRFDDLGEDIGQPSGPLSLTRVRQTMQQAESLLAARKADADKAKLEEAGAVQQQVVEQLDKLIAELSKQCQGGQCQSGDQSPEPSQRSQPKSGKPASAAGRGTSAARDSTTRLDRADARPVDNGDLKSMVKELWGHLPQRSREQMMQSFSEEFLPKYELEIEQYYRRLSEDNETDRRQ